MNARPAPDETTLAKALKYMLAQPPADFEKFAARVADVVVERLNSAPIGWSVKAFAGRIGRKRSYVYSEIAAGRLRARQIGGVSDRFITPADAEAWMRGAE